MVMIEAGFLAMSLTKPIQDDGVKTNSTEAFLLIPHHLHFLYRNTIQVLPFPRDSILVVFLGLAGFTIVV
jgi:hypothetical protein